MASFTLGEAFTEGWKLTKPNIWKIWKFTALIFGVGIVFGVIGALMGGVGESLMSLVSYVFSLAITMGYLRVMLMIMEGKPVKMADLFWFEGKVIWAYFAGSIIYFLIVMGGLFLLIIPGIIWALMFGQYYYVIADKKLGPIDALKYSQVIMRGNKWQYFLLGAVVGFMNMMAVLLFLIPLIVTIPLSTMIMVWVYRKMTTVGVTPTVTPVTPSAPPAVMAA